MNAQDLPPFVTSKELKSGKIAWYWSPTTRDRKQGCPLPPTPLGSDFADAMKRGQELSQALFDWRMGREPGALPSNLSTLDWLFGIYRAHRTFPRLAPHTRRTYDRAMGRFGDYKLKNGHRLGGYPLHRIDPQTVDAIYDKFYQSGLRRDAALAVDVCRRAWKIARRCHPHDVPGLNPFEGIDVDRTSKETVPASWTQLQAFCAMADEMGHPDMAFAALVCWELLQRPEDVFSRLAWSHWRPADRPGHVLILHNKNRSGEWVTEWTPLEAPDPETGEAVTFYPQLEHYAQRLECRGTLMLMRAKTRGRQKPGNLFDPYPRRFREKLFRKIADAAGLPAEIGMAGFRHGGLTELGDAALPDTYIKALSRHKQRATLDRYIHRTDHQKLAGIRQRLEHRKGKS